MLSSDPLINLQGVEIMQGEKNIFQSVDFSLQKGEFAYLIGRTGSGKTSLLRSLYADLAIQNGDAQVLGFDLKNISSEQVPFLRRKIGIVFQDFQLLPDRSVGDNLYFVLKATGWRKRQKMKHRIAEVLMQVGLSGASLKMPHQLSGGEQQRVVIARALLNEPALLLADEPTGNLDPEVAQAIMKLFLKINRSGTSVLMATHNNWLIDLFPARVLECLNQRLYEWKKP